MKRYILILLVFAALMGCTDTSAQQKSIAVLLKVGLNSADEGFFQFINDTIPGVGEWKYRLKQETVNQFGKVSDININIIKNHKSILKNEDPYVLYRMKIICDAIIIKSDLDLNAKTDFLNNYFEKVVNFLKTDYGTAFNSTAIIKPQNSDYDINKPLCTVYFYDKSISLQETLTDNSEIERQLDILKWFTVEMHKKKSDSDIYYIVYRINGARIEN